MAQRKSKCVFCGQSGASKEHIIARWIGKSLSSAVSIPGATVTFRHRSVNPEAGLATSEKSAKGTAFTTRSFCRQCNRWMGELEEEVKPILEPMLHGRSALIDDEAKSVLSRWAMKTVLAFQAAEAQQTTFARPQDNKVFRETGVVLPNTEIWLGSLRRGGEVFYRAHSTRLNESAPGAIDGFGATLVVGYAAFYLLHGYRRPFSLRISHTLSDALRQIHPSATATLAWPLHRPIDFDPEIGLTALIMRNSVLGPTDTERD